MEYETNIGWQPNNLSSSTSDVVSGTNGKYENNKEDDSRRSTIPKVDRHGFVVSHQFHSKVSSLPNPSCTGDVGKRRELKWLEMVTNWDKIMKKSPEKVKTRCFKGIPQSIRSLAWQHLTGAIKLKEKLKDSVDYTALSQNPESEWYDVIKKDIPRTFRHHSMFYEPDSQGQEDLTSLLVAFSGYDTDIGYNQALAPIAAILLMHMPPQEAFWILVSVCTYYLPGYYGEKMEAMRLDGLIFAELLESNLPHVHKHMTANNIDPLMYIVEWMVCIFARCLPFQTVLRIWDMFFCEGVKFLFKVGLAILKLVFPSSKDLVDKDDFQTTQILNSLPKDCTVELTLIPVAQSMNISEREFEKIHKKILVNNPDLDFTRFGGKSLVHQDAV